MAYHIGYTATVAPGKAATKEDFKGIDLANANRAVMRVTCRGSR